MRSWGAQVNEAQKKKKRGGDLQGEVGGWELGCVVCSLCRARFPVIERDRRGAMTRVPALVLGCRARIRGARRGCCPWGLFTCLVGGVGWCAYAVFVALAALVVLADLGDVAVMFC